MSIISAVLIVRVIGWALAAVGGGYTFVKARSAYRYQKRVEKLEEESRTGKFLPQFSQAEIRNAITGYVEPKCSPADPANSDGEAYLSDIREPVFEYMDRAIKSSGSRNYILLLADSGMGKTTFCINYRSHLQKISPDQNCAVISLASPNCEQIIAQIENKSDCILLLDALDEDPKAISGGRERLDKILDISTDFQSVIVTCRSQFFTDDNAIPVELRIARVGPRPLGQNQNITLKRFYLAPFDEEQIRRYINRNFPRWNLARWQQRKRAFKLVSDIPELSARPMLLERLPELARGDEGLSELYELYEFMVQGWANRESKWIDPNKLLSVSQKIAISMYRLEGRQYYRVSSQEIKLIANTLINNDPDWNHLTTRSLLNRDGSGYFKFAHKSIMEFFVVRAAISGDANAFSAPWTPFMKELFISWGYSPAGMASLDTAQRLLTGAESRRAIMPLSDYWATSINNSFPNFRYSASRRVSGLGSKRLAAPQWRGSNISFTHMRIIRKSTIMSSS